MPEKPSKSKKPTVHYDPVAEWERQEQLKKKMDERRGEVRYPFTAGAEITDLKTGTTVHARTSDLSAGGCYVDTMGPLSLGTQTKVRIIREKKALETNATVNYSQPGVGMGLAFTEMADEQRALLTYWVAQLSGSPIPVPASPAQVGATGVARRPREPVLAKLIMVLVRNGYISEGEGEELLRELRD